MSFRADYRDAQREYMATLGPWKDAHAAYRVAQAKTAEAQATVRETSIGQSTAKARNAHEAAKTALRVARADEFVARLEWKVCKRERWATMCEMKNVERRWAR